MKLNDLEKARVLRILREYFPNGYDEHGQQMENNVLALKVAKAFEDADRVDFIEERALLSYTGVSFDYSDKKVRMSWRAMLGQRLENVREAIDWARRTHPVNPAIIKHEDLRVAPMPQAERAPARPTHREYLPIRRAQKKKSYDYGDATLNKIMGFIYEQGSLSPREYFGPDTNLLEEGSLDSLDHIELVMTIEDEYMMQIPDDDAYKLVTGNLIAEYVHKNRRDQE